jgi:hypothetical protein
MADMNIKQWKLEYVFSYPSSPTPIVLAQSVHAYVRMEYFENR